jgi:hypothetical protein
MGYNGATFGGPKVPWVTRSIVPNMQICIEYPGWGECRYKQKVFMFQDKVGGIRDRLKIVEEELLEREHY